MTCIIGYEKDGKVWIGGDAIATNGWNRNPIAFEKVFLKTVPIKSNPANDMKFLMGYTGSFRMGQLIQFGDINLPGDITAHFSLRYLVCHLVPEIRRILKDGGFTKITDNREESDQFLVGFMGGLYIIDSDFQVNRHERGYAAIGSGAPYAMGAFHSLVGEAIEPEAIITRSLEAAADLSAFVTPPFCVKSL